MVYSPFYSEQPETPWRMSVLVVGHHGILLSILSAVTLNWW
jgi:hypothetical protein